MLHFVTLLHQEDSYLELEQFTSSRHSRLSTEKATQIFGSLSIAGLGTAQPKLVYRKIYSQQIDRKSQEHSRTFENRFSLLGRYFSNWDKEV